MPLDTTYRTNRPEIMDNFDMEGEVLRDALDKIAHINRLLGGNKVTIDGIRQLLNAIPKSQTITIVDVGCGNGDMLRTLADLAKKHDYNFKLIGFDANAFTIQHAQSLSKNYSNISYRCEDIFAEAFKKLEYDIVLCTLTMHHFSDSEIAKLLEVFDQNSKVGIVINDLHRSKLAYRLFQALCFVFRLNDMSREDGLTSILRGFKKEDLLTYSEQSGFKKYTIRWKWAFRYQWIISKS